ncbi:MAG: hypothetical protein R2827_04875 [Bdellovibrionales bacterium]
MLQKSRSNNKVLLLGVLLVALLQTACAGFDKTPEPEKSFLSHSKLYRGQYDKVWRAVQIALSKYPIKINNIDTGVIETQSIPDNEVYKSPLGFDEHSSGRRYVIKARVIRMDPKDGDENSSAVKVIIKKDITLKRDFFAAPERLRSDGLEEKVVLYRIGRELLIDNVIEKAATR